ncbi:MAG: hypothetical protein ABWW66_04805 [Archaeoglobaceae archaeon]
MIVFVLLATTLSALIVPKLFGYDSLGRAIADTRRKIEAGNYDLLRDATFWTLWTCLSVFVLGINLAALLTSKSLELKGGVEGLGLRNTSGSTRPSCGGSPPESNSMISSAQSLPEQSRFQQLPSYDDGRDFEYAVRVS